MRCQLNYASQSQKIRDVADSSLPLSSLDVEDDNSCSDLSKYNETIFTSITSIDKHTGIRLRSHDIYRSYHETAEHGIYYIEFELKLVDSSNTDTNLIYDNTINFVFPILIILTIIRKRITYKF